MKTASIAVLLSVLGLATAAPAPVAESACVVTTTSTCTIFTTTITTTASVASACVATTIAATTAAAATTKATAALATDAAAGVNIQAFTGTLGGAPPPVISGTGKRPFSVKGDTFVGSGAALGRSCDVQHNACANAANSGQLDGGVSTCDKQNNDCHAFISTIAARRRGLFSPSPRAALDLGSCTDTTIVFESGLDGRDKPAFIAADQADFNHGSALNIAVIAGFICQRLESSCKAGQDATAACARASAAAVAATQDQAAADAFNSIMGGGAAVVAETTAAASAAVTDLVTTASAALAGVQTGVVVQTITSCT